MNAHLTPGPSEESWRRIPSAPDYEVSDLGRVRSVRAGRGRKVGRILSPRLVRNGYLGVHVVVDGRETTAIVHRCVGEAFLGPLPKGLVTRHLNGDKLDNRLVNIKYGTYSENSLDQVLHGTHACARQTHCKRGHELAGETVVIDSRGYRDCKPCRNERQRRAYASRKVAVS